MGAKNYKPTTPSRRQMTASDGSELTHRTALRPAKALLETKRRKGGRNNQGRITSRFRSGGHKRRLRIIDQRRNKLEVPGRIVSVEYDPNRSANIALVCYLDGEKRYILAPKGLKAGDQVVSSNDADIQPGNAMMLKSVPMGALVHGIELKPGRGAQMVRSAGASAQVMARESGYVLLRLPSGEMRRVLETCRATIGEVGNASHENIKLGKAGRARWLGRAPHNRGVTMNPVDHPHGGGEGRTSGGGHPRTPWGKKTKGAVTRRRHVREFLIVKRRPKKK